MDTAVKQLAQVVDGHDRPAVVAVFFAGHGFQDREANYLVPKDAKREDLANTSMPVSNIVVRLAPRRAGVSILFLDACRTLTPLAQRPGLGAGEEKAGFGQVPSFDGAILSLAPGYNQPALSRAHVNDINSPYTEGLRRHLNEPGTLARVFGEVYKHVKLSTQNRQQPETLTRSRLDTFGFMPRRRPAELDEEDRHWRATVATNRFDCVEGFLIDHPDSRYVHAALRWKTEIPPEFPTTGDGSGCPTR